MLHGGTAPRGSHFSTDSLKKCLKFTTPSFQILAIGIQHLHFTSMCPRFIETVVPRTAHRAPKDFPWGGPWAGTFLCAHLCENTERCLQKHSSHSSSNKQNVSWGHLHNREKSRKKTCSDLVFECRWQEQPSTAIPNSPTARHRVFLCLCPMEVGCLSLGMSAPHDMFCHHYGVSAGRSPPTWQSIMERWEEKKEYIHECGKEHMKVEYIICIMYNNSNIQSDNTYHTSCGNSLLTEGSINTLLY